MYRSLSHRRCRPVAPQLRGAAGGADFNCPQTERTFPRNHRLIVVDLTVLRRRTGAIAFLALFIVSIVGSWRMPTSNVVSNNGIPPTAVASVARHMKHGFRLAGHPEYKPPKKWSALHAESESEVKTLISLLNQAIDIPTEVELSFQDCRQSDVYYDEDTNRVTICRQWFDEMERVLSRRLADKAVVRQTVQSVAAAVFLHETAHALIDILDLPVTGREEDAADQFSTLVLLSQKDGVRKAMQVAYTYKVLSQDAVEYPPLYWGEHSLNIQRYYDTLCMIYGRNPKENIKFLGNDPIPPARADICEGEYDRIEDSWKRLLQPFVKTTLWQAR